MAWVNQRVSEADRHISRYSSGEGTMIEHTQKADDALETSQTHLTYTTLPPNTYQRRRCPQGTDGGNLNELHC